MCKQKRESAEEVNISILSAALTSSTVRILIMYPNNDVSKQERESAEEVKRLERQLKEQRAGSGDKREFQKKQLVSLEAQLHSAQVLYVCLHTTKCVRIPLAAADARGAAPQRAGTYVCPHTTTFVLIPLCVLIPLYLCSRRSSTARRY